MKTSARRERGAGRRLRFEPLEPRALLASFLVTNNGDSGAGTLRDAIERANLDPAADTIDFAPAVRGQITLASALPDLTTDLAIRGPGAGALAVARPNGFNPPSFRIFTVTAGASVAISGLTISGGRAEAGGGISNAGTLVVSLATLSRNDAFTETDGVVGSGGGIFNTGTLTVEDSTFDRNETGSSRTFSASKGGAISNQGTLTVVGSTFNQNASGGMNSSGGAIDNAGTATIATSTFSANTAVGGGRYGGQGYGGAIANTGTLDVESSTFADNVTAGSSFAGAGGPIIAGGGIINRAASARLSIGSSLFSGNVGGSVVDESGTFSSRRYNLFSDRPSLLLFPGDIVATDPLLGPLADNGGPTWTRALLPGSPAIDFVIPSGRVTTDQRGVARPQGVIPDIGAFESRGFTITPVAGTPQSAPVGSSFPAGLTVMVSSPFGEPVAGGRVTFTAPRLGPSAVLSPGSAPIDPSGRAEVRAAANGRPGTYDVVARGLSGDPGVAFVLTNTAPAAVVGFKGVTPRRRPTTLLTLSFSDPLDPARAADAANYRLVDLGPDRKPGTRDDRRVKIRAAAYDPAANTVTLAASARLSPSRTYRLTAVATPPRGLADRSGTPLDGDGNRQPGGDYVVKFRGPRLG